MARWDGLTRGPFTHRRRTTLSDQDFIQEIGLLEAIDRAKMEVDRRSGRGDVGSGSDGP
jgi:hypothetical protein